MGDKILDYYARKDVQEAILRECKQREVGIKFGDKGYGKRPDVLLYPNDLLELAKQGATSFHISEERWKNPLDLKTGMSQKDQGALRAGWDLVIDIDCKFIEFSKLCADLIIQALKFHGVENVGLKFSGGSGFHICVPFESFPEKVNNQETKLLFPEGVRVIASYLKEMIRPYLKDKFLEISTLEEISKVAKENIRLNDKFNPFSVIEIDAILISSRHLFRAPYSINEKTGLVSIPIKEAKLFNISDAKIENVKTDIPFLVKGEPEEAKQLIVQAFDWYLKSKKDEEVEMAPQKTYSDPTEAIKADFFPPCILLLLKGVKEDGRKRGVFIFINFLKKMGWAINDIEQTLLKWNQDNGEPLREGYIRAQISWHKRQQQKILPPNCDNSAYYKGMGICKPDGLCSKIKNPVQYAIKKLSLLSQNKPKAKKSTKNKSD
ncbi:MAG: hypothetical protein Q8R00_04245 [Candidatus Nanoarchaeia archaeon]|nr:hypothetical protein [Candidatus Nanoarchaeia archaeon]